MNALEKVVGKEDASKMFGEIVQAIGSITSFEQISGGLVHYVFRITSESQSVYLKVRGHHFSQIPDIKTQPEVIAYEKKALEIFYKNSPEYFPGTVLYSSTLFYLLLEDVMPDGITLDKQYIRNEVSPSMLFQYGYALGNIHLQNSKETDHIRFPDDRKYQSNLMQYAFERYDHPVLHKAADEHKRRFTQLLIGDLSPKNAYVNDKKTKLCDLENAHQGSLAYDQSFALAHILLHQESRDLAFTAISAFMMGYRDAGNQIDEQDTLIGHSLQAILLYRLDNRLIPYDLPFSEKRKKIMAANVMSSLDKGISDLETITVNLYKE